MITFKLIGIFIVGFGFTALALSMCKFYNWKNFKPYLLLILGLIIMYIPTFGPLSKSKENIEEIQNIEPNKVISIVLSSTKNIKVLKIIKDKKSIEEICNALKNSEIASDDFMKNTETSYHMQINLTNKEMKNVELKFGEQVTCIDINSNGLFKWRFGKLESKNIQNILLDNKIL